MPTPRNTGAGTRRQRPQGQSNSQGSVKRKRTAKDKAGGKGSQDSHDLQSAVNKTNRSAAGLVGSSQEGGLAGGKRGYEFLGMWRRGFPEHITDPFRCGVCTIGFSDKASRNEHEKFHSQPENDKLAVFELHQTPSYQCPHCSDSWKTAEYRDEHVKGTHRNSKPAVVKRSNRKTLADFARLPVSSVSISDSGQ